MNRIGRSFLLAAITIVVVFGLLEVLFRTTHLFDAHRSWSEPDPVLGWRYTAGRAYWHHKENDHPITGRINSFGWRDRERSLEKRAGSYRVAVLGDSYVEALQVELDSTFLQITERRLNAKPGCRFEVMNFGRSGMTQTEEYLLLTNEVLRFHPDHVMVFFAPVNDVADINPRTADTRSRPFYTVDSNDELVLDTSFVSTREFQIKRLINKLKQRSALVSLLTDRYNLLRRSRQQGQVGDRVAETRGIKKTLSLCTDRPEDIYTQSYRLNKRLLAEMADACRKARIDFTVASVQTVYRAATIDSLRAIDASFDPGFFDRDLQALADSVGFGYFALQPHFEQFYARHGEKLHWGHWNYNGHRLVGGVLAQTFERYCR